MHHSQIFLTSAFNFLDFIKPVLLIQFIATYCIAAYILIWVLLFWPANDLIAKKAANSSNSFIWKLEFSFYGHAPPDCTRSQNATHAFKLASEFIIIEGSSMQICPLLWVTLSTHQCISLIALFDEFTFLVPFVFVFLKGKVFVFLCTYNTMAHMRQLGNMKPST